MFASADWDSRIRIYGIDLQENKILQKANLEMEEPCLSVAWADDLTKLFTGCIDNSVKYIDLVSAKVQNVGRGC